MKKNPLMDMALASAVEKMQKEYLLFEENGHEGFAQWWMLRALQGYWPPFGPVKSWGADMNGVNIDGSIDQGHVEWYVATFSRAILPHAVHKDDERVLIPGLKVNACSPYLPRLGWVVYGYNEDYGGNFLRISYGEIPSSIQAVFTTCLESSFGPYSLIAGKNALRKIRDVEEADRDHAI